MYKILNELKVKEKKFERKLILGGKKRSGSFRK